MNISVFETFRTEQTNTLILQIKHNHYILVKESTNSFVVLNNLDYVLVDFTASNYPERSYTSTGHALFNCKYNQINMSQKVRDKTKTISHIYTSAIVAEREIFEMFNISFTGHADYVSYFWTML